MKNKKLNKLENNTDFNRPAGIILFMEIKEFLKETKL